MPLLIINELDLIKNFRNVSFLQTVHLQGSPRPQSFVNSNKKLKFAVRNGALAEWLGAGLQNLSQWFDSATHLQMPLQTAAGAFAFY